MSGWDLLRGRVPMLDTQSLDRFVGELHHWNRAIRLVGPRDEPGIRTQIVDALMPLLIAPPEFPLLDIGSGAGLPALPLAILHPAERVVCLEPQSKRVSFLRHAARVLGLARVEVVEGRAEEAYVRRPELGRAFRTVTARAVADVATLLAWSEPYLAPGGRVILGRGGESGAEAGGWRLARWERYSGPAGMAERTVAVYERIP